MFISGVQNTFLENATAKRKKKQLVLQKVTTNKTNSIWHARFLTPPPTLQEKEQQRFLASNTREGQIESNTNEEGEKNTSMGYRFLCGEGGRGEKEKRDQKTFKKLWNF